MRIPTSWGRHVHRVPIQCHSHKIIRTEHVTFYQNDVIYSKQHHGLIDHAPDAVFIGFISSLPTSFYRMAINQPATHLLQLRSRKLEPRTGRGRDSWCYIRTRTQCPSCTPPTIANHTHSTSSGQPYAIFIAPGVSCIHHPHLIRHHRLHPPPCWPPHVPLCDPPCGAITQPHCRHIPPAKRADGERASTRSWCLEGAARHAASLVAAL